MKIQLCLALLFGALASQVSASVQEYTLDNGIKLIVKEDHRAPVVVSQVWYRVGSSYETEGITGVSHALEHMMFKGTPTLPAGEFSRLIAENGGRENAFTSRDYTAYFQRLEKDRLEISFRLESDRMRNLTLPEDEFLKEIQVIMEERRLRTEDKPQSLTYEQFQAMAYINSSYHSPVIGWMSDLESMTIEDMRAWYKRWYAPNNAIVVVAGDVEPEAVLALAKRYFGPLKPETIEPPRPRTEVKQRGTRRIQVKAPAELPYILMGYKVPSLKGAELEWEPYALEVLAGVLGSGASARLERELVRGREIASDASVGYSLYARLNNLLLLDGTPAPGQTLATLEAALLEQVQRLRDEPVTESELARIKAQVVAESVFEQDSVFYQAMKIGQLETVGLDWRLADEYSQRIRAVTPEQIQAVARKYLVPEQLTVAELDPLPINGKKPQRAAAPEGGHVH